MQDSITIWPHPLILDYGWPVAATPSATITPWIGIAGLLALTLWALRRRPALGFLGLWCFGWLAPTSSILPIRDLAFEHRMYLPLAACACGVVLAGHAGCRRLLGARGRRLALALVSCGAAALLARTIMRNTDYTSAARLWRVTAAHRPEHPRAHNNYGRALADDGRLDAAERAFAQAVRLDPGNTDAQYNLGLVCLKRLDYARAADRFAEVVRLRPRDRDAHARLAEALLKLGRPDEAAPHLDAANAGWAAAASAR